MANIVVPSYLQNVQSSTAAELVSGSGSFPTISLKGRKFTFKEGKEVKKVVRDRIHVVILGVTPPGALNVKTLYLTAYNPNTTEGPDCHSEDGIRPDGNVFNPVNDKCGTCQYNQWGSADGASKGKKCSDSKYIYVVEADDVKGNIVYRLQVPTTSLKALSSYGREIGSKGAPLEAAVTQITMADSDYPQLEFDFVAFLPEDQALPAIERAKAKEWSMGMTPVAPAIEAAAPSARIESKPSKPAAAANSNVDSDDLMANWG